MNQIIDKKGYRLNIGIILVNQKNQVFWGRRHGQPSAWQFPQGGIRPDETLHSAMYRELYEEVGLQPEDVQVLAMSKRWYVYQIPKKFRRYHTKPLCIGQKQRWFLLRLISDDQTIDLMHSEDPEFDRWRWVPYWQPAKQVVAFKRGVYHAVLREFASTLFPNKTAPKEC